MSTTSATNDMTPCIVLGTFGSSHFGAQRRPFYGALLVLSAISFVFTLAALFPSASLNNTVTQDVAWTTGSLTASSTTVDIWLSLKSAVVDENGAITAFDIEGAGCTADWCEPCAQAGQDVLGTLAVSFISQLISIALLYKRGYGADDNLAKFVGVLNAFFGFLCILGGLAQYSDKCHDILPTDIVSGYTGVIFTYGPGFALMATVLLLRFPIFLVHLLTPVAVDPTVAFADTELEMAEKNTTVESKAAPAAADDDVENPAPVETAAEGEEAASGITLHLGGDSDEDIAG